MKSYIALWIVLVCFVAGCDAVTLTEPIGEPVLIEELKLLEGTWANEDNERFDVGISSEGDLIVGSMSWDEQSGRFEVENEKLFATQLSGLHLLCAESSGKPSSSEFWIYRYELVDKETVHIYFPLPNCFQRAVESGELEGSIQKQFQSVKIHLTEPSEVIEDYLSKAGGKKCFSTEPSLELKLLNRRN